MPLNYDRNAAKNIRYNNQELKTIRYNNNVVFERNATVTYIANGTTYETRAIDIGQECIGIVPNPTRAKYAFLGWSKSDSSTDVQSSVKVQNSDPITLYAVWKHTHIGSTSEGGECYNDLPIMCYGQIYTPYGSHYIHACRICNFTDARSSLADEDAEGGADCNAHIGVPHLQDGITKYALKCDIGTNPVVY